MNKNPNITNTNHEQGWRGLVRSLGERGGRGYNQADEVNMVSVVRTR